MEDEAERLLLPLPLRPQSLLRPVPEHRGVVKPRAQTPEHLLQQLQKQLGLDEPPRHMLPQQRPC